jgi:hypothetical protein
MAMKVTARMKKLREAYLGEARGDHGVACRLAGYKLTPGTSPAHAWNVLKRRNPGWIAALELELQTSMTMRGKEIDERLTALARDPSHRDHYKALELLAKMSGKLKDQVIVVSRDQLNRELDSLIGVLKSQRETELPTHSGVQES